MSDQTLIADLMRAGVEPELVGRVSNALVNVRDNVRDNAVREYETGRKRNWRKTIAAQQHSTPAKANDVAGSGADNVPQNVPDKGQSAHTLLSNLSLNLEGSIEEESKPSKKARSENTRARGTRMQAGAVLSDADRAAAIEIGADPQSVGAIWAEFVDYWIGIPGQRGTKIGERGWSGTWRNRVRMIVSKGNGNGNGPHYNRTSQAPRSGATGQDAILAGMGRLAARVAERGASERRERDASADDDTPGRRDARLL